MADKYYITGDINTTNKNYGEKRVEIGGGGGGSGLNVAFTEGVGDKTIGEIKSVLDNGGSVVFSFSGDICPLLYYTVIGNSVLLAYVSAYNPSTNVMTTRYVVASATDESDYPEVPIT